MGLESNRMLSQHIGMKGYFGANLAWKGMLTTIKHLGTYSLPYPEEVKQLSGLFELTYNKPEFPVYLGVSLASDTSNGTGKNFGLQFTIGKQW